MPSPLVFTQFTPILIVCTYVRETMPRTPRPKAWSSHTETEDTTYLNQDARLTRLLANQNDDEGGGDSGGEGAWTPPFDPEALYQVFLRIHEQHRGLKAPPRNALQNDVPIDPELAALSQQDVHPLQKSAYFSGMADNQKESMIPSENTDPNIRNEYNLQLRKRLEHQKQLNLNMAPRPY